MLLPQTAEYALRAMAYLATLPPGTAVPARDLAEATQIPVHYLSKILRRLVLEELLWSQKGHGGGFTLSRPPEKIDFISILRAADFTPTSNRCAFGLGNCDQNDPCPLHQSWSKLEQAFFDWASQTTLADVRSGHAWPGPRPNALPRRR